MEKSDKFDFAAFQKQAIQGLYEGKPLSGEKGIFAPLLKHFLEAALEGELSAHLAQEKAQGLTNRKNGKSRKQVKSLSGDFVLETTRDRSGSFEPQVLPKREVVITAALEEKVIGLYSLGLSYRDIAKHIAEIYVQRYQLEAIEAAFPYTQVQSCIIHQIRNTLRYVAQKDKKAFMADLKEVYQALTEEEGFAKLEFLQGKWGKKYGLCIESWFRNWTSLATFFAYDAPIRKVIYTTNTIEGFNRQLRKVTKTKGAFSSDQALLKLLYLVSERICEKWTMPLHNWGLTLSQLYILFEDRIKPHLTYS